LLREQKLNSLTVDRLAFLRARGLAPRRGQQGKARQGKARQGKAASR
jgi:hypothetical protein